MHINYQADEKYNKKGLLISIAIHAVLLLGFFFIIVMTNPPADPLVEDGSGIPVNFGYDDFGMGDNNEQPSVEEAVVTPIQQEQQEETAKQAEVDESEVVTTTEETPYKVEEKKEKKTVKETKPVKEPVKEPKDNKPAVTESKVTPKLDKRNSMGNGDKDKAGDQGSANGTLDSKNYYGNGGTGNDPNGPGGGNGTGLNMTGWRSTSIPKVTNNSDESGKIVFKITVDDEGTILSAIPVENQLSPSITKLYKDAVMKITLEKTSTGKAAETSVGYYTFIIRAK